MTDIKAWTMNEEFDKNGYLVVKNICDPASLVCELPEEKGMYRYYGNDVNEYHHYPDEIQVSGSIARYWYPQYKKMHSELRKKLEGVIGRKLYNTYFYDRFYFPGQCLEKHKDRDACEISVSIHVRTNLPDNDSHWPLWITTPEGKDVSVTLEPGDGMIYKGCDCTHWRDAMPKPRRRLRDLLLLRQDPEYYFHQIFFHYVLADGKRAHFAGDGCK